MTRIVIFVNGLFDPSTARALLPNDIILCADGGANHALALGLTPSAVLGDFDSLTPETIRLLESKGVTLLRFPRDKDKTDLELTLEYS